MDYEALENLAIKAVHDAFGSFFDFECFARGISFKGHWGFVVSVRASAYHEFVVHVNAPEWWESVETKIYSRDGRELMRSKHWLEIPGGEWRLAGQLGILPVPIGRRGKKRNRVPTADRVLDRLHLLIPRRQREDILGDLYEDVAALREDGYSEKMLCRYVYWQVFCAAVERLKPWNWGAFVWLVHKFIR